MREIVVSVKLFIFVHGKVKTLWPFVPPLSVLVDLLQEQQL
jgi:hypothetical protein